MEETKMLALATEVKSDEAKHIAEKLGAQVILRTIEGPLAELPLTDLKDVEIIMPFIHSQIGSAEIAAMPNLKLIATRSTGFDHIDLEAARERKIPVCNVPGYGETAVAEYTFALLLTLSRKVHLAQSRTKRGDYNLEGLRGFDLYGKTLGVIGAGAIGLRVIRIAAGFGMRIIVFDEIQRKRNRLLEEVLGFSFVSLDTLLQQADIVTLHAPALPATYHMINHDTLAKTKKGAYLVNTARGTLVDTPAVAWALDEGILAGVALDTFEGEEFLEREEELLNEPGAEAKLRMLVQSNMLQRRPNVIITPHVAFNSNEALLRILDTTIENIHTFLNGDLQNVAQSY
ncbi:NAD(P)-dependent oxidoreductase [Dictyobacter arantiisoli]|uniref:Lactate dehydrogenase n=1 Tax=Dictyobacter arantiisoli TaxID=2014874 RepID=A0A5A5TIG5_9CHLR|nr:NAD(P)-dependent oxidoreductase [Dictyobacter arantiisoli]GCF11112.1 lactate dehydrogenase [Dictyobacter arantiisoli]